MRATDLQKERLFDPSNPDFRNNPYPYYEKLRNISPVYYRRDTDDWVITGYDAVEYFIQRGRKGAEKPAEAMPDWSELKASGCPVHQLKHHAHKYLNKYSLFSMHGDEHALHKKLIQGFFSRSNLEPLLGGTRNQAEQLLHSGKIDGRMDLIGDFAKPLALTLVHNILGISDANTKKISHWANAYHLSNDIPPTPFKKQSGMMALMGVADLIDACFRGRKSIVEGGFLAFLQRIHNEQRMAYENAMGDATMIAVGYKSLQDSLGIAMKNLLLHPDQAETLIDDNSLIDKAINELLRYGPPIHCVSVRTIDMHLGDAHLQEGQTVYLLLAAANRDPDAFTHPNQLDIAIKRPRMHLSLGTGEHYCLGATLSKIVMKQALLACLRYLPSMRLVENRVSWEDNYTHQSLRTLPVIFGD